MGNIQEFSKYQFFQLPQFIVQYLNENEVISNITNNLEEEISNCIDIENAKAYFDWCQLPGTKHYDYMNYILETNNLKILAGICFQGGDKSLPFIDIFGQNRSFSSLDEFNTVRYKLLSHFKNFNVNRIRITNLGRGLLTEIKETLIPDLHFVIGKTRDFQIIDKDLSLIELPKDWYSKYINWYDYFHKLKPELVNDVSTEARKDLEKCEFLKGISFKNQFVGLMAIKKREKFGIPGYYIVEEVINPDFWGKGLGIAIQKMSATKLHLTSPGLIMGTIYNKNVSSLKTALKCERTNIGGTYFSEI